MESEAVEVSRSILAQIVEEAIATDGQEELLVVPSNATESADLSKKSLNKNNTTSKIVSKTQDVTSNWRAMDIEKIHEMGSADEQSRLVSSRLPENIQPEDSVNNIMM